MTGIAIYVEGGGDHTDQKAQLRTGFDVLLKAQKDAARARRLHWKLVPCGGRNAAYDAFVAAIRIEPPAINVLLVDSEEGLAVENGEAKRDAKARVNHLTNRDGCDLNMASAERIHLMVQCMEAWIVADPDALAEFYGQYFARNALPGRQNLEEEPKQDVYSKLEQATGDRRLTKGRYGKIKHAAQLLQCIDPAKVVKRCPRFATFTKWLDHAIASA
ncbi:MAG: DUF4276 family protein [Betaproteobacteria bacterium]|nr:DUF4276 family protein [Betaproteobacteria bacterium]